MEARRLDEVRKELEDAHRKLAKCGFFFNDLAKNSGDNETLKSALAMLSESLLATRSAFTQIENLYLTNAILKKQVETLKDMLLSIPEIKNNQQFRERIQKEFEERHNVWY